MRLDVHAPARSPPRAPPPLGRHLAIRGAAALAAEHGDERARIEAALDALGVSRATGSLSDLPPPIRIGDPADRLGSAALQDVRGDR